MKKWIVGLAGFVLSFLLFSESVFAYPNELDPFKTAIKTTLVKSSAGSSLFSNLFDSPKQILEIFHKSDAIYRSGLLVQEEAEQLKAALDRAIRVARSNSELLLYNPEVGNQPTLLTPASSRNQWDYEAKNEKCRPNSNNNNNNAVLDEKPVEGIIQTLREALGSLESKMDSISQTVENLSVRLNHLEERMKSLEPPSTPPPSYEEKKSNE